MELKDEERTRCEVWIKVMSDLRLSDSSDYDKQAERAEPDFRPSAERVAAVNQYVADLVDQGKTED